MNLRTFFFIQVLSNSHNIDRLKWLFNYLFINYGNVMIKVKRLLCDIDDGQKVCEEYNKQGNKQSTMLISNLVWPHLLFNMDLLKEIKLHPALTETTEAFTEHYKKKFQKRSLMYLPLFGTVELLDKTQEVTRSITVNPLQASILLIFNSKDDTNLKELTESFGISEDNLLKYLQPLLKDLLIMNGKALRLKEDGRDPAASVEFGESSSSPFSISYIIPITPALSPEIESNVSNELTSAHITTLESYVMRVLKQKLVLDYNNIKKEVERMVNHKFK